MQEFWKLVRNSLNYKLQYNILKVLEGGGELKGLELSLRVTHTGCFTYISENINSTGNLALYNIKENKVSNKKDNFWMFLGTVIIMLQPDSPIGSGGGGIILPLWQLGLCFLGIVALREILVSTYAL